MRSRVAARELVRTSKIAPWRRRAGCRRAAPGGRRGSSARVVMVGRSDLLKSKNQMSGGKLSRPRARPRSGSAAEEPRVRPIWSSSSIEKRAMAPWHAALEGGGWIRRPLGMNNGIVRLPGMVDHLALDQGRGHVDRPAAALDRRGRHEGGVVADPVVGPGADGVVERRSGRPDSDQRPAERAAAQVRRVRRSRCGQASSVIASMSARASCCSGVAMRAQLGCPVLRLRPAAARRRRHRRCRACLDEHLRRHGRRLCPGCAARRPAGRMRARARP